MALFPIYVGVWVYVCKLDEKASHHGQLWPDKAAGRKKKTRQNNETSRAYLHSQTALMANGASFKELNL